MILAIWFNVISGVICISALVLAYYLNKRTPNWIKRIKRVAQASTMSKKAWVKVYGRDAIRILRKLVYYASELDEDEVRKLKADLTDHIVSTMSDYERKQVRETTDDVIDGGEQLEEHELTWLTYRMGNILLQSEEENTKEDAERFRQLCVIYDDLQKQKTKLRINCPGCGRPLKRTTQAMIGDIAVCPKCKVEFTIEQKDEKLKDQ